MTFRLTPSDTRDASDQRKSNALWEAEMALAESFLAANPDDSEVAKHAISVFFSVSDTRNLPAECQHRPTDRWAYFFVGQSSKKGIRI